MISAFTLSWHYYRALYFTQVKIEKLFKTTCTMVSCFSGIIDNYTFHEQ